MTGKGNHGEHSGLSPARTLLEVHGMTCENCARHVSEAIQGVAGVRMASVNLETQQARVHWETEGRRNIPALLKALSEAGYPAEEITEASATGSTRKLSGWALNIALGVPATLILMLGEWVFGLGLASWFRWLSFWLAAVVQVVAGAKFYRGAFAQIKVGRSNMDTLVALGSSTAFGFSTWALLSGHGGHVYFMESSAIITLISLGHWFESRMAAKASVALQKLLHLAPAMARRVSAEGTTTEVPVTELVIGDIFQLRPGNQVPTDGAIIEGNSLVDESMLTGESAPVEKAVDSQIYGGTVNLSGRVLAKVTAVGEETALSHIVAAVQRAQGSRAQIQRLGDRVSSVFVPVVVSIALGAALWWGLAPDSARSVHSLISQFLWKAQVPFGSAALPFMIAAAVLIVACPCAMGLATPAAIMAGSNAAAQHGILIRDGIALEKAGTVTAVLFDKTGTLTAGKPRMEAVWAADGQAVEDVRKKAGELARHSTHPVSQAVALPDSSGVRIEAIQEIRGAGIQGTLSGQFLRLGSIRWLQETGVSLDAGNSFAQEWATKGATVVGFAVEDRLGGLFAVRDTLKPSAPAVVQFLLKNGLRVFMVTGDNRHTAEAIAKEAGIPTENLFSEVRPEQKADFVRRLQQSGEKVAFVGDGINDAPALEQADLGVAVSKASDIAREAADIILLKSEIEAVPESLGLARATLRTIKQNLFWAFVYNALGVPLAALGFMSPILCAAAMGFSDLIVIGNALRLRNWRLR